MFCAAQRSNGAEVRGGHAGIFAKQTPLLVAGAGEAPLYARFNLKFGGGEMLPLRHPGN